MVFDGSQEVKEFEVGTIAKSPKRTQNLLTNDSKYGLLDLVNRVSKSCY